MKTPVAVAVLGALSSLVMAHPLLTSNLNGIAQPNNTQHHRHHHHSSSSSSSPHDDVRLALDGGWYSFQFGKEGTWVDTEFCFYLHGPAILKLTDYYCAGDRFGVKDNGVWLGATSYVPFDHCRTNTTNPSHAYSSHAFSHAAFHLSPGSHRISIKVLLSPYNGGSAAIRLDSVFNKCLTSKHGLVVINTCVPFCEAKKVCESYDMDLADLDIYNFLDATDVAFQCAGAFSKVWINSWSENDYGHSCLALSTGVAAPGGSINIPDSCNKKLPVLCQARKHPCGWEKPCHRKPHCDCSSSSSSEDCDCHHHKPPHHQHHHHGHHKPCSSCHEEEWECWTNCQDDWSYDGLECQPHMPCWPQWCLKHGKCDIAKDALSKRRVDEEKASAIHNAKLAEQAKKQVAEQQQQQKKLPEAAVAPEKKAQVQQAQSAQQAPQKQQQPQQPQQPKQPQQPQQLKQQQKQ